MDERLILVILTATVTVSWAKVEIAGLFPFQANNGDKMVERTDDGSSPAITIATPFRFLGKRRHTLWVNTNGMVSFISSSLSHFYDPCNSAVYYNMICPFLSDVDTSKYDPGRVFYRESMATADLEKCTMEVKRAFPNLPGINVTWSYIVTWYRVTSYDINRDRTAAEGSVPENTFQLALASDGNRSFAILYYNKISWAKGIYGSSDTEEERRLKEKPAKAGFYSGDLKNFYFVPGSCTNDILNLVNTSNVESPGTFVFRIDTNKVEIPAVCSGRKGCTCDYGIKDPDCGDQPAGCVNVYADRTCEALKRAGKCTGNMDVCNKTCVDSCRLTAMTGATMTATPISTDGECMNVYRDEVCEDLREGGECDAAEGNCNKYCILHCIPTTVDICLNTYSDNVCESLFEFGECDAANKMCNKSCIPSCRATTATPTITTAKINRCINIYSDETCNALYNNDKCDMADGNCDKSCNIDCIPTTVNTCVNYYSDQVCEALYGTGQCDAATGMCNKSCSLRCRPTTPAPIHTTEATTTTSCANLYSDATCNALYMSNQCDKADGNCNEFCDPECITKPGPCKNVYSDMLCEVFYTQGKCDAAGSHCDKQCLSWCQRLEKPITKNRCQDIYPRKVCQYFKQRYSCGLTNGGCIATCRQQCSPKTTIDLCTNVYDDITCKALYTVQKCAIAAGMCNKTCDTSCYPMPAPVPCFNYYSDQVCMTLYKAGKCNVTKEKCRKLCDDRCSSTTSPCMNTYSDEVCQGFYDLGLCNASGNACKKSCTPNCRDASATISSGPTGRCVDSYPTLVCRLLRARGKCGMVKDGCNRTCRSQCGQTSGVNNITATDSCINIFSDALCIALQMSSNCSAARGKCNKTCDANCSEKERHINHTAI